MRTGGLVFLLWVAPAVAAAQYPSGGSNGWSPVQGAVAGGVMFDSGREEVPPRRDDFGFGALYLGMAFMPAPPPISMFYGAGVEATVAGARGPYQLSIGAGTRVGIAYKWTQRRSTVPDFYAYVKFLPFIGTGSVAGEEYLGDHPTVRTTGAGVRVAIGFTAPAWTSFWYRDGNIAAGGVGVAVAASDIDEAAVCCLAFLVAGLLNHLELTYETYGTDARTMEQRIGVRIGVGF